MKHKINVKGVIVSNSDKWIYDLFDIESTSPKDVSSAIESSEGKDLEVIINSGGGSVYDGSEIFTELKSYAGNVNVKIVGLAASAASVIAMAGDNVAISPTGQMMIHNSSTVVMGDYRDMENATSMLKKTNQAISNAYKMKTGIEENELFDLMNKQTWMSPQDAKEKKFVDEIMFEEPNIKMSASTGNMIPQSVIDGIRNGMLEQNKPSSVIDEGKIKQMLADFKDEIKNDLKPKEPTPAESKQNLSKLFLNL